MSRPLRAVVKSATIVENPTATAATATASARIGGLHGSLLVSIAVAYISRAGKTVAVDDGCKFRLYGRVRNEQGDTVALSPVPVNGPDGQTAPDCWEGTTTAPELDLVFDVVGVNAAADVGRWDIIVTAYPTYDMCVADFQAIAEQINIAVNKVVLA